MNQFTFESRQKTTLISFMVIGLLCLIGTFIFDQTADHTRFWTNLLHNTVYFTGISFISLFVLAAFTTAFAGWYTVFKRVWEAYAQFLVVGLVLFTIIIAGVWMHWHHLYHWAMEGVTDPNSPNYDKIIDGKSAFLNKGVYTFGTIVVIAVWFFFARKIRSLSVAEDQYGTTDFNYHQKLRFWSACFLPIAGATSCALIWQWVMSIDAHWYSTMYAWYATASWFVGCLGLTIMTIVYLKSKGYLENVTPEHLHDLGKYMFAFSIFWTYLWFSQYMLIWYANVGEETIYFRHRVDNYPVLFYGNLIMNFILPFFILMRNSTKRKYGTLIFVSIVVFFGHWWDFFLMIKPGSLINAEHASHAGGHGHGAEAAGHGADAAHGASHGAEHAADHAAGAGEHMADAAHHVSEFVTGFTLPGLLEIGTFLGFTALFLFIAFSRMTKASLSPENDPYFAESVHHHV